MLGVCHNLLTRLVIAVLHYNVNIFLFYITIGVPHYN